MGYLMMVLGELVIYVGGEKKTKLDPYSFYTTITFK